MTKPPTTGRRILQMIAPTEEMCVALRYGTRNVHQPLIAWALIEDDDDEKQPDLDTDQRIMPVYLDEYPQLVWPSESMFQDCGMIVHSYDHCARADYTLDSLAVAPTAAATP